MLKQKHLAIGQQKEEKKEDLKSKGPSQNLDDLPWRPNSKSLFFHSYESTDACQLKKRMEIINW